jgi:hypothetical protein
LKMMFFGSIFSTEDTGGSCDFRVGVGLSCWNYGKWGWRIFGIASAARAINETAPVINFRLIGDFVVGREADWKIRRTNEEAECHSAALSKVAVQR